MYWFGSVLLAVSLPKEQSPFYQNSTHILKTHKLMSNTCTELPKYWSVQEQTQLSLYHKHYLRWDLNNFGARLSHSVMESTVTMVVLFVTRLASETEPLTDWLDPELVLHDPMYHAQSQKTRKNPFFLKKSQFYNLSSWRWVRMGLFFNNSCWCKWHSFLALLLRWLAKSLWKPLWSIQSQLTR